MAGMHILQAGRFHAGRLRDGMAVQWRRVGNGHVGTPGIWFWWVLAVLLALFLCSTVFHFGERKVDEPEVVLNALTIATGDWNPVWSPGYGHLAMYLPAALIALLAGLLQLSGAAASYHDGLYLLFADDAVYRITRYLYTLADVGTALLLARLIVKLTAQRWVALGFVLYFLVSPDTWFYANYVRTDTLVSFFLAGALLVLASRRRWFTPYLLGIMLGAAIACKYSAVVYLALAGLLLLPLPGEPSTWRERLVMAAQAGVTALAATFVFQPLYDYSGIFAAINRNLSGGIYAAEAVPMTQRMTRLWNGLLTLEPRPLVMAVLALGVLPWWRRSLPLLAAAVLSIAPFALSSFVREYWLLPFADVLRAAGWLGVACLVRWAGDRLGGRARWVPAAVVLLATVAVGWARWPDVSRSHDAMHRGLSNREAARRWLYLHVANREPVYYGNEKSYLVPRAYSFHDYPDAVALSRMFVFHRERFEPLHELFRRRLYSHEFADFSSMTAVPHLRLSVSGAAENPPQVCAGSGCYRPHKVECTARARSQLDDCVAYSWDMDRPSLRHNLAIMGLELPPAVDAFTVCWYDCKLAGAEALIERSRRDRVPLTRIAAHLFAPARMLRLTDIDQLRNRERVYIVTTPRAYRSWLPKALHGDKTAGSVAFAKLAGVRLIRYFDADRGPRIEIYVKEARPPR